MLCCWSRVTLWGPLVRLSKELVIKTKSMSHKSDKPPFLGSGLFVCYLVCCAYASWLDGKLTSWPKASCGYRGTKGGTQVGLEGSVGRSFKRYGVYKGTNQDNTPGNRKFCLGKESSLGHCLHWNWFWKAIFIYFLKCKVPMQHHATSYFHCCVTIPNHI